MFQFDKCCRPSGESKSDRKLRSRYLRNAPYKKERKNDINLRRSINNDDIEIYFKIQKNQANGTRRRRRLYRYPFVVWRCARKNLCTKQTEKKMLVSFDMIKK